MGLGAAKPEAAFAGGRTSRFRRGALATLFSQVVRAGGQIVLVPIFLAAWGDALYGEWLTLSALTAQMALFDMGVQTYVLNRLNQCYARGELAEYARILHSALFWCLIVAAAAALGVSAAALALPVESFFRLELVGHGAAAAVVALLAVQVASQVPYGLVTGIYRTVGEYPRGVALFNAQRLALFALTAGCVLLGGGLVHVALVQIVPLLACLAWVLSDLRRRHPEIAVGTSRRESGLARSFLGPSSLFFVIRASQAAAIQGTTLVASAVLGPASVAVFVTLRTPCNLVRQVSGSLGNALWPEVTALEARDEKATLRRVHALAVKVVTAASVAAAVFLHHAGGELVRLWTGGELVHDPALMDALLLLLVLQAPWTTSSIFLVATNRHRVVAVCYAVSAVLGLALAVPLARAHGLAGLALGLAAAELAVCSWAVPRATCALLGERGADFARRVLLPLVPVAAGTWLASGAAVRLAAAPVAVLLASAAAVAAVAPALTWILWLDDGERTRVRGLLGRIVPRAR